MFDWASFEQAGLEAAVGAMTRGAALVSVRAKQKAPVQEVFKAQEGKAVRRLKSIREIEADRDVRRQLGLSPEGTHLFPPLKITKPAPQLLHLRDVSTINVALLNRRGRYELHSGRSVSEGQLGGRLQREITYAEAKLEGRLIRAMVLSPTPYARFQEFGTHHNAAHPYMRPAAHESAAEIKADVAGSVAQAARQAARGRKFTVAIKLKAVLR